MDSTSSLPPPLTGGINHAAAHHHFRPQRASQAANRPMICASRERANEQSAGRPEIVLTTHLNTLESPRRNIIVIGICLPYTIAISQYWHREYYYTNYCLSSPSLSSLCGSVIQRCYIRRDLAFLGSIQQKCVALTVNFGCAWETSQRCCCLSESKSWVIWG